MTDSYNCPAEGCEFGDEEEKSLAQVRAHINSKASGENEHPGWDDLKDALLNKAELSAAQADDGDASGDESDDEATVEADADDLTDAAQDDAQGDDEDTDEDTDEMASQEEYQEQYSDDQGDDQGDDQTDQSDQADDGTSLPIPAVSPSTALLILGALAVAYLAWRMLGSDAASDYEEPTEQADDDGNTELVDIEAGTGGVDV